MDSRFCILLAPRLLPVNRRLLLICRAVTKVQIYKILIGDSRFLGQSLKVGYCPLIEIYCELALGFAVVGTALTF